MTSRKEWEDLDMTRDELDRVANALKNEDFRKMFFEYCEEFQDPENRKKYQEEITQLEAERGVEVTFLEPDPGFVVKTSADGKMKAFVNIAKCDKIERPSSEVLNDPETGKPGVNWKIPLAQSPSRRDADNKGKECVVYDVLFHPDALYLAEKNGAFRRHLISTACDAVEREFGVKLDRSNLKYPKLKFKGISRPVVIRKLSKNPPKDIEPSPIDSIYPPLPKDGIDAKPKVYTSGSYSRTEQYATPSFLIKHRRGVDMAEMTYELDAKLNVTIPKELVVEIELPLLRSASNCILDVTERRLFLVSEKPAKYKLCVDLPFSVNDKAGSAKFDQEARKLTVVLPVCPDKERKLKDIYREDSDDNGYSTPDDNGYSTPDLSNSPLIEVLKNVENQLDGKGGGNVIGDRIKAIDNFLKETFIKYNFPSNFDCNTIDENLAYTLHVKNADPQSLVYRKGDRFVHLRFSSMGSGYYPVHYAFYVTLPDEGEATISSVEAEAWDNNVILTLTLKEYENLKTYSAGLNHNDLKEFAITEAFLTPSKKFSQIQENGAIAVNVTPFEDEIHIDIRPTLEKNISASKDDNDKVKDTKKPSTNKKQRKKNKKRRSLSESSCDDLKTSTEINGRSNSLDERKSENIDNMLSTRKVRSVSESRDSNTDLAPKDFKGILKHRSRYGRSISESCSSIDEMPAFSSSVDLPYSDSITDIPEEGSPQQQGLSESCKKTVRFSDVIRKQLFRLDSSILGQRKKNQKRKNQKQRALQRRNSEGDTPDYFDKPTRATPTLMQRKHKKLSQHDSGLDLSEVDDETDRKSSEFSRNRKESESSDIEFKNTLMFDMEM